jgi:hypothetical protein
MQEKGNSAFDTPGYKQDDHDHSLKTCDDFLIESGYIEERDSVSGERMNWRQRLFAGLKTFFRKKSQ